MIAALIGAGAALALVALVIVARAFAARLRRGNFPLGFVDETRLRPTKEGHVEMNLVGIDGSKAVHVLDARQAHVLSSQLLGASARAQTMKEEEN